MRCHAPSTRAPLQAKADTNRVAPPARRIGGQEPARGERAAALPTGPGVGFSFASVPVHTAPVQQALQTGLPEPLKAGVEWLSGLAMDDVRVHRDSPEPARLGALAFACGSDIHLGPGQERHLPHEAWHVVQQKQGRVAATTQMKAIGINDDVALEAEADRLGSRAAGGVGFGPTKANAADDAALQPPEQGAGGDLAAKAKRAKERVKEEAEEKFGGDYQAAYLALRSDPALWTEYAEPTINAMRTYVYLPSYEPDPQPLNLCVDFEFYVPVGMYTPGTAEYPNISIADVVQAVDSDSAARIRTAVNARGADVSIEAILSLDTFNGLKPTRRTPKTTVPIEQISITNIVDTSINLVPSGTVALGSSGPVSTRRFRLAGKATAAGQETTQGLLLLSQVLGRSKKGSVKAIYP